MLPPALIARSALAFSLTLLALLPAVVADDADLKAAIADLGADTFLVREKASERLLAAGAPAIPLLEAAAERRELETTTRALDILESLAVEAEQESTRSAAFAAVARLATARVGRAEALLAAIRDVRRAQAMARLVALGAKVDEQRTLIGPGFLPVEYSLEIGSDWRGTDDDLKLLALVNDLRAVSLIGERVNDAWLEHLATVPTLQSIKLKRAKVTAAGIERLKELKELYVLDILYFPLDDDAVRPLAEMRQLSLLRLFDTKVSKEAAAKLAIDLPNTKIDVRRGGFLGIGVDRHPLGCIITRVEPKSVAFRAGLDVGDIILAIGGERPADFQDLTTVIARYRPGEEVPLQIYRGEERETLKIKLGEWD